jgi:class 3 adenylate cyclase
MTNPQMFMGISICSCNCGGFSENGAVRCGQRAGQMQYTDQKTPAGIFTAVNGDEYSAWNHSVLGLGNSLSIQGPFQGLAAIFDLQGFTDFCSQADYEMEVSKFLASFLKWLFAEIKSQIKIGDFGNTVLVSAPIPVFAKFLGDGVLFVWDVSDKRHFGDPGVGNIVKQLWEIKNRFCAFYDNVGKEFSYSPKRLRCGVARSYTIPIGEWSDFVGRCINLAARLQKLGSLSFAFSPKGMNRNESFVGEWHERFMLVETKLRGVGPAEHVMIDRDEWSKLPDEEKNLYKPVTVKDG